MGWSLPDCDCVSLHGRALERIVPLLQPGARILALSWDGSTPGKLATLLKARGFGASTMTVLEAMGGPRERIRHAAADDFDIADIDPLNTVAIEIVAASDARVVTLAPGLPDTLFENDGQLTKAEIRALTLSALAPKAGELLWDIGPVPAPSASNGACAIRETAASASRSVLSAPSVRGATRRSSARRLSTSASAARRRPFADLPAPDAVFIGGGRLGSAACSRPPGLRSNPADASSSMPSRLKPRRCSARSTRAWRHHAALGGLASRACRRHARLAGGDARHAMGGDEAMIVAGVGFRRSVAADEIVALVELALDRASLARDAPGQACDHRGARRRRLHSRKRRAGST